MKCNCGRDMIKYKGVLMCPDCNADTINEE